MTVKELIEQLEDMDPKMEVHIAYNYGDYWKTEVAPEIDEVDVREVTFSEYHNMDKIARERDDGERDEDETREVVVLR